GMGLSVINVQCSGSMINAMKTTDQLLLWRTRCGGHMTTPAVRLGGLSIWLPSAAASAL
ncbi:hypothetical protein HAX54_035653, partial [Datura stramonium]|nr:hypothetical protein [Datura stramonium]